MGMSPKPTSISINQALDRVAKIPSGKGEFETTVAFNSRVDAAASTFRPELVRIPLEEVGIVYNADSERFEISSFAFDYVDTPRYFIQTLGTTKSAGFDPGDRSYVETVASEKTLDTNPPTYLATNAFGVARTVTRLDKQVKVIFDHEGTNGEDIFDPPKEGYNGEDHPIVFAISADQKTARQLKGKMTGAVLIVPKAPYLVTGQYSEKPTLDSPYDVHTDITILVADIRCAVVMDHSGVVIGAQETR